MSIRYRRLSLLFIFMLASMLAGVGSAYSQGIEALEERLSEAGGDSLKAEISASLAEALLQEGRAEESISYADQAMSLSKNTSDIRLLSVLGRAYRQEGEYASALNYYLQAQQELSKMDEPQELASMNMEIGELYKEWGILEKAVEYFQPALAGWKELGEKEKAAIALKELSDSYTGLGDYIKALEYSRARLEYFEEGKGDTPEKLNSLKSISDLLIRMDKPEKALEAQRQILEIYKESADSTGISSAYNNIGFLNKRMQQLESSLKSFEQSVKYSASPSPVTYINMGVIHQVLGNYEPSLLSFFEAAKIYEKSGDKEGVARVCNYISAVYQALGDSDNALRYTERAIEFGNQAESKSTLATSYKALSDIYSDIGRNKRALSYYKEYVEILQEAQQEEKQRLREALQQKVEAESKENDMKLLLVDKELNELSLRRLQLETEKKEQGYQLQLQQQKLENARLEQQELEKEKNLQALILEKKRISEEKKDNEIKVLQANDSLQQLALKQKELEEQERLKDIELLKQKEKLQRLEAEEQKVKAEQERQKLLLGIGAIVVVLLLILAGLLLQRRANAKLRRQQEQLNKQNLKLQEQSDEISVQAEELMQQKDEIIAQRDYIEENNKELEQQKASIEKAYDNIRVLSDIGQQITSTLSLSAIIQTVYESVNRLMDATSFGIGIYSEKLEALEFKDFIEKDEVLPYSIDYLNNDSLPSVQCFIQEKEIVVNNLKDVYDVFSTTTEENRGELPVSLVYMPLRAQGRKIGVITVQSFKENSYTETELTILRSLASYASIALENSHAYDQLIEVNELINQKNEQITDSLRYARTIEESILPTDSWFQDGFADYFTVYRPKDIVSGDFFWGHSADGYTVLAVVDCTGHGVPGAFMSMIGNALLNRIIRENKEYDPATILSLLNQGVKEVLNQQEHGRSEGMDVVLCRFAQDGEGMTEVVFSGAKRPLYILNEEKELSKLKGDKLSIGWLSKEGAEEQEDPFSNQVALLPKGTQLYLTTDGFVDNPAPERVKIGSKKLEQMIVENADRPMKEQGDAFARILDKAAEVREQRDDITLVGVTLK